jgi:hypothetical protein
MTEENHERVKISTQLFIEHEADVNELNELLQLIYSRKDELTKKEISEVRDARFLNSIGWQ